MPREDITVMENTETTKAELQEKIVRLTEQLTELEGQKKSAMKGFNDTIKDIKEEIKMTLDLIKEKGNE